MALWLRFLIVEISLYLAVLVASFTMHYMLRCTRLNLRDNSQELAFRASRVSGTRSIEVALAEIQIIKHNVYVQRKERSLPEVLAGSGSTAASDRPPFGYLTHCNFPLTGDNPFPFSACTC